MIWEILSIASGAFDAVAFASIKKLGRLNTKLVLILRHLITLPFLLFGFLFYDFTQASIIFYLITLVNAIILVIAMYLLIKSIRISDISASIPMLSFTPLFLLLTSYFMLNEVPNFIGFIGIMSIVIGSYILNLKHVKSGYLAPFKMIFSDKGVFYMFIVAFLFSITSNLVKIGVELSNPAYFIFFDYLFASAILTVLYSKELKKEPIIKNWNWILVLAISTALMELTIAVAVKFALVSYIISLKRTSVIFSVLIGFLFFKEKNFKAAFIGTIIMFIGAVFIALS